MISRAAIQRQAQRALRQSWQQSARGYASPASGSLAYQQGDANGVKYAGRDYAGPVTTLALVSKAGTRHQSLPGLAEALERYAFRVGQEIVETWDGRTNWTYNTEHRETFDPADTTRI